MKRIYAVTVVTIVLCFFALGCVSSQKAKEPVGLKKQKLSTKVVTLDLTKVPDLQKFIELDINYTEKREIEGSEIFSHYAALGEISLYSLRYSKGYILFKHQGSRFEYVKTKYQPKEIIEQNGEEFALCIDDSSYPGEKALVYNLNTGEKLTDKKLFFAHGSASFIQFDKKSPAFIKTRSHLGIDFYEFYDLKGREIASISGHDYGLISPNIVMSSELKSDPSLGLYYMAYAINLETGKKTSKFCRDEKAVDNFIETIQKPSFNWPG